MNFYDVLGVAHDATQEEVKAAYRKASSQHHPDRGGDHEQMQRINEAYEVLGDERRRRQYDEAGAMDPNSIEAKAQAHLDQVFRTAIANCHDPINHAYQTVGQAPKVLKTRLMIVQQQKLALQSMQGKTRRTKGRNRIDLLIGQRLEALEHEEREAAEALQVANECIRMLGEYEVLSTAKPKVQVLQYGDAMLQASGRAFE